ncbi:MAG: energy transducer TonB [Betaproteobacteria bacterium]|nr:energy transducer TonB [Candidatus Dechloromonas phosphorivorans]
MSYALSYASSRPSSARRSGLLGIVIGLHVAILLVVLAAKTIVPQIMEIPLVVDLLQAPEVQKPPEAKPLPMAKPQPVKQPRTPTPKAPTPLIEATTSTAPAPSAPVAVPQESQPAPPVPPAEAPIKQARFDADYLKNRPRPTRRYPSAWVRGGQSYLRVLVNPQGTADNVEIKTSSGSPRLDESAQKTVRTWKFIPAKRGDEPVQSWVLVPIIFKLEQ